VGSVRILSSNLSKRIRCLGISPPIRILRPRQGARRLVRPSHSPVTLFFKLALFQGHLGAVPTIRPCLVPRSLPRGSVRLVGEGRLPLVEVAEHLVRQVHLNLRRQVRTYLDNRVRLVAHSGQERLVASLRQVLLEHQPVCPLEIHVSVKLKLTVLCSKFERWDI
jgi:hypothetical protein